MNVDFGDLQAHVLLGFNERHQRLLFFTVADVGAFKRKCGDLVEALTWTSNVLSAQSAAGARTKPADKPSLGLSFAFRGLEKVSAAPDALQWFEISRYGGRTALTLYADSTRGSAFKQDCMARANSVLLDPINSPRGWVIGGPGKLPDGVFVLAAATAEEASECSRAIQEALGAAATILHEEVGERFADRREHFGFLDGGAVPTVLVEDAKLGRLRAHIPQATQFYPGDTLLLTREEHPNLPESAIGGSFLAFRRLQQDVFGFHEQVQALASSLALSADVVAARICGRSRNGVPLIPGPPNSDDFTYAADPEGLQCPLSSHIRRANPRNENNPRPLYRRSVPYGSRSSSSWNAPRPEAGERGLLFMCYQSSLERQFEYVSGNWLNSSTRDKPIDALLGRRTGQPKLRDVAIDRQAVTLPGFVTATGGGYFFAPSRLGLTKLLQ